MAVYEKNELGLYFPVYGASKTVKDLDDISDGIDKVGKTSRKSNKDSRKANLLMIELGRGASDAQFGVHGLGNNLQRMLEIFGDMRNESGSLKGAWKDLIGSLWGPGTLIAGLSVLIQYGPAIYDFFKEKLEKGAKSAEEAIEDLNEDLGQTTTSVEEYLTALQKTYRQEIEKASKEIEKLDKQIEKHSQGGKIGRESKLVARLMDERKAAEELRDKYIDLDNTLIDGMQNAAQVAVDAYEKESADKAAAKAAKERAKEEKELNKVLEERRKIDEALEELLQKDGFAKGADAEKKELDEAIKAMDFGDEWDIIKSDDVQVVDDYTEALEDLQGALEMTGSAMAKLSDTQAETWAKANEDFEKSKVGAEDVAESIASAFESAATQGGNFFQNLAGGILSSLGSLLIQEGTAYVALGIARNALIPGSGAPLIAGGVGAIAAGTALKAGGSAIGSSGSGRGSYGGGTSYRRAPMATVTPTAHQGDGSGYQVVRGQDIRYINQTQDDTYSGFN